MNTLASVQILKFHGEWGVPYVIFPLVFNGVRTSLCDCKVGKLYAWVIHKSGALFWVYRRKILKHEQNKYQLAGKIKDHEST